MDNVVNVVLKDPLHIRIETDDYDYLNLLKEEFTYHVENYQFMPKYKSGMWNGTTCLMKAGYSLPYGLLLELLKINKKEFPRITTIVDNDVKNLFRSSIKLEPVYDLKLFPYPYQSDCIEKALKYTKGIIRSTTASGKSLMISYITKTLLENKETEQCLIVVPTKSLVEQFYSDMKDYEIEWSVGRVHQKYKEWDKDIVISTWQTLMRNPGNLVNYNCIVMDECHQTRSFQLSKILKKSHAKYRYGFTGTLHAGQLDNLNVFSYLGPVIAEYSSAELAKEGYISKCNVNIIDLSYNDVFEGDYNEVKDAVFTNNYRLSVIKEIVKSVDHNVLLLVGKVEKEGDYLKDWLEGVINKKEIVFLSGRDDVKEREKWRKACLKRKDIILIATYGIFSTGINIPNLKYTVLAAPFKSKIRVLQSIGRNLRKFENKEKTGAVIYDIHDETKYLNKHGNIRARYYSMEGFNINEMALIEGDVISL